MLDVGVAGGGRGAWAYWAGELALGAWSGSRYGAWSTLDQGRPTDPPQPWIDGL